MPRENQCLDYRGCDDRDCPMASWCVRDRDHKGQHDYETTAERNERHFGKKEM